MGERVTVFHKSIVDWLTGSPPFEARLEPLAEKAYLLDIASAQRQVAKSCATALLPLLDMSAAAASDVAAAKALRRIGAGIKGTTPAPFTYSLRWTAAHLLAGAERAPSSHLDASSFELGDAAATLLCSVTYLERRVREGQLAELSQVIAY